MLIRTALIRSWNVPLRRNGSSLHETSHDSKSHPHYHSDENTGYLFGLKKGEKYKKEGWEDIYKYGFWGAIIFAAIAWNLIPDTRLNEWAKTEAIRRRNADKLKNED